MCYSSSKDFGWGAKKDATREPEARQQTPRQTPPDRTEPTFTARDFTFWAFPRRRKDQEAGEPAAERTRERV